MRQPVGPFLELAVGDLPVAAGHCDALGKGVRGVLEEVGKVQGHGNESRTCYCSGQAFADGRNEEIAPMTDSPADDVPGAEPPHALIERRGHVLIVTMNRPSARNALSGPMMALMRQAWDQADSDPGIRVCVLTGAGGAFSAGAALVAMTSAHPGSRMGEPGLAGIGARLHRPPLTKPLTVAH